MLTMKEVSFVDAAFDANYNCNYKRMLGCGGAVEVRQMPVRDRWEEGARD